MSRSVSVAALVEAHKKSEEGAEKEKLSSSSSRDRALRVSFREHLLKAGVVREEDREKVEIRELQALVAHAKVVRLLTDLGVPRRAIPSQDLAEADAVFADPLYANLVLNRPVDYGTEKRRERILAHKHYEVVSTKLARFSPDVLFSLASVTIMRKGAPLRTLWDESGDIIPASLHSLWDNLVKERKKAETSAGEEIRIQQVEQATTAIKPRKKKRKKKKTVKSLVVKPEDLEIPEGEDDEESEKKTRKKKKRKIPRNELSSMSAADVRSVLKPRRRR